MQIKTEAGKAHHIKNTAIAFGVYGNGSKRLGDVAMTNKGLVWSNNASKASKDVSVKWDAFINWMQSQLGPQASAVKSSKSAKSAKSAKSTKSAKSASAKKASKPRAKAASNGSAAKTRKAASNGSAARTRKAASNGAAASARKAAPARKAPARTAVRAKSVGRKAN